MRAWPPRRGSSSTVAPQRRARIERIAGFAALALALAGLAVSIAFAGRVWSEFTNPGSQLPNSVSHLGSAKSNRWTWWQEAWHAFTRHPGGGTGAGTFELTNQMLHRAPVVVDEPHSTPLQFLSETGIVGLLLYLGVAGGALWGAWRARRDPAGLALGLAVAAFFVHGVVDKDWNYVATCGPLFLLAGGLLAQTRPVPERRPLLAACAVACALAAVYSLAAPWLAQRELAKGTAAAFASAHSYDPLSVDALQGLAAFEDRPGHYRRADRLYRDAVALEPQNAETWYALGVFYFEHRAWRRGDGSARGAEPPRVMPAGRHQRVHQVVAPGDAREHRAYERRRRLSRGQRRSPMTTETSAIRAM